MIEKFMPDIYQKSIYYINYDKLYKKGIRCLLFDLDNTITPSHSTKPTKRLKKLFDDLKDKGFKIIIVSNNINNVLKSKYEHQYNNVTFINNNSFHDRFIIIDRKLLYSSGASFKDLGKKCFAISEFNDINYLEQIINTLNIN